MNKKNKSIMACIMSLTLAASALASAPSTSAAKKIKLNKTKITLTVGKSTKLKVNGTKTKVKWSSSNKKVAIVTSNGKVLAKKVGSCKVKAKVAKKSYTCKVTVKAKGTITSASLSPSPSVSPVTNNTGSYSSGSKPTTTGTSVTAPPSTKPTGTPKTSTEPNNNEENRNTAKPTITPDSENDRNNKDESGNLPSPSSLPNEEDGTNKEQDSIKGTAAPATSRPSDEDEDVVSTNTPASSRPSDEDEDEDKNNITSAPMATPTLIPSTPNEGKEVSLALDFYLDPFDTEDPDEQFVIVNFINHLGQDVYVETEAYVTTKGEKYAALISDTQEGETVKIEPTDEEGLNAERLIYDSLDYVKNDIDATMWWLPLDENSTLTFFFRVGEQRYKAIINYDQKGALYQEANDYEQLIPFASEAPTTPPEETVTPNETNEPITTTTPIQTEEPIETEVPTVAPTITPEPKNLSELDLNFYLGEYNTDCPDEQLVFVNFVNHCGEDILVESKAYVTTRGEKYAALMYNGTNDNRDNQTCTIKSTNEDDNTITSISYDSWDWVKNGADCTLWWLPLDENSTITFFFRIGEKRYKATVGYKTNSGVYYDANDTEQLEPFIPQTSEETIAE